MTRRPPLKGWPRLFARPEKLTRSRRFDRKKIVSRRFDRKKNFVFRRFDRKQNLFPEDSIVKSQLISLKTGSTLPNRECPNLVQNEKSKTPKIKCPKPLKLT